MNLRKMSITVLACMLFVNSFQVLASEEQTRIKQEKKFGSNVRLIVVAIAVPIALMMGITLNKYKIENAKMQRICQCAEQGGGLSCAQTSFHVITHGCPADNYRSSEPDYKHDTVACMQEAKVIYQIHQSPARDQYGYTCDAGFYESFEAAAKACEDKVQKVEIECFKKAIQKKCDNFKKG